MNMKLMNLTLKAENKRLKEMNMELIQIASTHVDALIKAKNMLEATLDQTGDKVVNSGVLAKALARKK